MKNYKLRFLPGFYKELEEAVNYISDTLKNPQSAEKLISEVESAILNRLEMPLAAEPYQSSQERKNSYYRIYIGNYIVFYVVIDDVMEVRRFFYGRRDFDRLL